MKRWAAQATATDDDEHDRDCSERIARLLDETPGPANLWRTTMDAGVTQARTLGSCAVIELLIIIGLSVGTFVGVHGRTR
jgi:hypothetical protein